MSADTRAPRGATRRERQAEQASRLGLAVAGWSALGTSVQILVTSPAALPAARAAVEDVVSQVDLAASRFRPDSELSRLNAAGGEWCDVSPLLAHALRVALDAAAWTDGLVDPTVGASLVDLGYDRTFRLVPSDGPAVAVSVRTAPGWQQVRLADEGHRVRLPAGVLLDLGATAKGLASDLAAEAAAAAAGCGVLVNLGGDVAVAGAAPGAGWPVQVTDVADPDLPAEDETSPAETSRAETSRAETSRAETSPAETSPTASQPTASQTVLLRSGGLATSSTSARRWRRGGSVLHHIVDPRSGLPATGPWRTVTATARTCVLANTGTTAAIVLGPDASAWLRHRGFAARLVGVDGRAVHVGRWPAPQRGAS